MGQKQLREFGSGISCGAKNRTIQHLSVFFSFKNIKGTVPFRNQRNRSLCRSGIIEMALSFVNLRSYEKFDKKAFFQKNHAISYIQSHLRAFPY
jgi:hypothetical protein